MVGVWKGWAAVAAPVGTIVLFLDPAAVSDPDFCPDQVYS